MNWRDKIRLYKEWRKLNKSWKEIRNMDKPLVMSKTVWGVILAALAAALTEVSKMLQGGPIDLVKASMIVLALVGTILAAIGGREAIGKCMKQ